MNSEQHGNGKVISLILFCLFHLFHRHLDIAQAITGEGSPLHLDSDLIEPVSQEIKTLQN